MPNNSISRQVAVGIMSGKEISFELLGTFCVNNAVISGAQRVSLKNNLLYFAGQSFSELLFAPQNESDTFTLHGVTIGKKFHWERKEDETFAGALKIVTNGNEIEAINVVDIEVYLHSVISSEMSSNAPLEYLKTQAVVSRSWLMRILSARKQAVTPQPTEYSDEKGGVERHIKWYENDAHTLFDVCADDHCQRYEGLSHAVNPMAEKAVRETCGEVLMYGDEICDARFSKSCGGVSEKFSNCWKEEDKDYLSPVLDAPEGDLPDLTDEKNAERWIRTAPSAFCNSNDDKVLSQVLNDYDLETKDFYRWKVEYSNAELSALIKEKSGIDFGEIKNLTPLRRGTSGRIVELLVEGTKRRLIIGKELEIRRILSTSHLKSSALVVDKTDISPNGLPARFILTGAGWGHGVGLCQIGAAVMSAKGYTYREILAHYFKNSIIKKIYGQS